MNNQYIYNLETGNQMEPTHSPQTEELPPTDHPQPAGTAVRMGLLGPLLRSLSEARYPNISKRIIHWRGIDSPCTIGIHHDQTRSTPFFTVMTSVLLRPGSSWKAATNRLIASSPKEWRREPMDGRMLIPLLSSNHQRTSISRMNQW